MNMRLFILTMKGLARNYRNVLKIFFAVMISFIFVTGILLFQNNMYHWQFANAKLHFGDWFIAELRSDGKANEALEKCEFLEKPYSCTLVNSLYDRFGENMSIRVGTMDSSFVEHNGIKIEQGHLPQNKNEIAVEWNSLIVINEGYNIGDEVDLIIKSKQSETGYEKRTYTISGILSSYTNVWVRGNNLPGVIVSEDEAKTIGVENSIVSYYPLKSFISEDDYKPIYERIRKDAVLGYYNENVYEFKPWGNEIIYRYMFVVVMLMGISAIAYQMIIYSKSRRNVRKIQKQLGADNLQLFIIYLLENTVIIVIASIIGIVLAILGGKLICENVVSRGTIHFYRVDTDTCVKVGITFVMSVLVSGLVNLLSRYGSDFSNEKSIKSDKRDKKKGKPYRLRKTLTCLNFKMETSIRLSKSNGFAGNIAIRFFSMAMTVIIIFCAVSVKNAYKEYVRNAESIDLIGYKTEDKGVSYFLYYIKDYDKILPGSYTQREIYNISKTDDTDKFNMQSVGQIEWRKVIKYGRTGMFTGLNQDEINNLNNIDGVKNISYGYYETGRSWNWENMDLVALGSDVYQTLGGNDEGNLGDFGQYLYVSEYVDLDEDLYRIIQKYTDVDYDDFVTGKVSVIFQNGRNGTYDDSLKEGTVINLMNYYSEVLNYNGNSLKGSDSGFSQSCKRLSFETFLKDLPENEKEKMFLDIQKVLTSEVYLNYYFERLTKDEVVRYARDFDNKNAVVFIPENELEGYFSIVDELENGTLTLEEIKIQSRQQILPTEYFEITDSQRKASYMRYVMLVAVYNYMREASYDYYFKPAASTVASDIIYLNEEVKKDFKEYIPEFGQYTMLASSEVVKKAVENQNELTKKYFKLDELPAYAELKYQPNQICLRYGLDSAFSSTGNIVSAFLRQSGFITQSFSDEKDSIRKKTLESIMFYGFTSVAAILIYLFVGIVITAYRTDKYSNRLKILKQTGADTGTIVRICMLECLRESVWCILLLPIKLIADFLVISRMVRAM